MKLISSLISLLFKLPSSLKLRMAGGNPLIIRGNTLDLDTQLLAMNSGKGPQLSDMPPEKARKTFRNLSNLAKGSLSKKVSVSDVTMKTADTMLKARVYAPKTLTGTSPLLIYFHGGGVVIGDLDSYEVMCGDFAEQLNLRVLAVDYRLAPENKFPSAATDAYASLLWAQDNAAELSIDPAKILLAGDSAGGYLSSVCSLQAIRNNTPLPLAQILIYPMADISTQRESYHLFAENLILTQAMMEYFINHYVNNNADKSNPLASPLLAADEELKQMPPTLVTVAGFDPLHDEGLAFYEKLKFLGVKAELIEHNDLTHGFITLAGVLKRGSEEKDRIIGASKNYLK